MMRHDMKRMPCRPAAAAGHRRARALAADRKAQSVHAARLPVHHSSLQALQRPWPERLLHPRAVHGRAAARRLLPSRLQVHVRPHLPASPLKVFQVAPSLQADADPLSTILLLKTFTDICRQFNSGYYCQAPQTPTYNFSDPSFAAQTPAAAPASSAAINGAGRHLLQASNSTATNSTGAPNNATGNVTVACNRLPYYGNCGERLEPCSWFVHLLLLLLPAPISALAAPLSPTAGCCAMIAWRVHHSGSFSEHSAKAFHCCDICWFWPFTFNLECLP